jgi:hypothetical protein
MNYPTPLHAKISVGESLPCVYFSPPSLPERPVLNVTAYFGGKSFAFTRPAHGADWKLVKVLN